MRSHPFLLTVLIASLGAVNCSDDSGNSNDPIVAKCQSVCAIDASNHCYSWSYIEPLTGKRLTAKEMCLQTCEEEGKKAAQGHLSGCGVCVAEGVKYSHKTDSYCQQGRPDVTCCYGVATTRQPEGPECHARCFQPDGGLPY